MEFEEYTSNTDPLGRHGRYCTEERWRLRFHNNIPVRVSPSLAILILFPISPTWLRKPPSMPTQSHMEYYFKLSHDFPVYYVHDGS